MSRIRTALLALALVAGVASSAPAQAAPATSASGTLTGTVSFWCYGCGPGSGTGDFTFAGVVNGVPTTGPVHADFNYDIPAVTCPVVGKISGHLGGVLNTTFAATWQPFVLAGPTTGAGTLTVTSPLGNPCGAPAVFATVVTTIAY
jgi:hypothetical protein